MAANRFTRSHLGAHAGGPRGTTPEWVCLSDLGRPYGLSALEVGRLLVQSEWRDASGEPTFRALARGLARKVRVRRRRLSFQRFMLHPATDR